MGFDCDLSRRLEMINNELSLSLIDSIAPDSSLINPIPNDHHFNDKLMALQLNPLLISLPTHSLKQQLDHHRLSLIDI